jgi:hypothetical protein
LGSYITSSPRYVFIINACPINLRESPPHKPEQYGLGPALQEALEVVLEEGSQQDDLVMDLEPFGIVTSNMELDIGGSMPSASS